VILSLRSLRSFRPLRSLPLALAGLVAALAGCSSDATDPTSIAGQEVLVAVNSTEASLSVVPVDSLAKAFKIPLGGTSATPVGLSARGGVAIVPLGFENAVAVVDLRARSVLRTIPLADRSGATGSAIVDDSIAYVANPNLNTVTRINYRTGDTASVAVGAYPQGVAAVKGRVYVINGNLDAASFTPAGPSWLTVIDPKTNRRVAGADSIALGGPGNAGFADVDYDAGLLYVMSTGDYASGEGQLAVVSASSHSVVATQAGFGTGPGNPALDRKNDRIYVSSYAEGVMVWDARARQLLRGAGDGLGVANNAGVAVDAEGRVYALDSGPCAGGVPGTATIFDAQYGQLGQVPLGECAVGAVVTKIPD
jgi:hypothetical protein